MSKSNISTTLYFITGPASIGTITIVSSGPVNMVHYCVQDERSFKTNHFYIASLDVIKTDLTRFMKASPVFSQWKPITQAHYVTIHRTMVANVLAQ